MVSCMSLGMQRSNLAATEAEAVLITGLDDALCIDRHDFTVKFVGFFLAVNALRSGDELRRIRHVRRASRVYHAARIRQRLHQCPGAAGMVQVDVGQENVIDVTGFEVVLPERVEQ